MMTISTDSRLPVTGGHVLYYEECGNPEGLPIVILHGGPGGGIHPAMRGFFDPARYRIILFDQRGCGQSTPRAGLDGNTIDDLIGDIERLRHHLGITAWAVAGFSWGTALAMLYALRHPGAVRFMILSGIFLADAAGRDLLCRGLGIAEHLTSAFDTCRTMIPTQDDDDDNIGMAVYNLVTGPDPAAARQAAAWFYVWLSSTTGTALTQDTIDDAHRRVDDFFPLVKIYLHFALHFYGDALRDSILDGARTLAHIPCAIVHGENDTNCPVANALALHRAYPGSTLHIVPGAGHSAREPAIAAVIAALGAAMADQSP